jgi:ceramide glucosyltransferase
VAGKVIVTDRATMDVLPPLAAALAACVFLIHLSTVLVAAARCRVPRRLPPAFAQGPGMGPGAGPGVTIIRPICGLDASEEATLRSTFALQYPRYEVLFCCASRTDPATRLVERLMAEHPHVPARLLIGDERISQNPKLNNLVKGWRAAVHGWIVMADSNVLMPSDFLQRLLVTPRRDTGLVSAPPIGCLPGNWWADLECVVLNGYQARWQYGADTLGLGFAQGKVMLWRRHELERAGGIGALAAEPAEDAAATKVVRSLGLRVRLADGAFLQPLGSRTAVQVWGRQLRWARLRRATFPACFALEPLSGVLVPALLVACAAEALGYDAAAVAGGFAVSTMAAEALLTAWVGWHLSWRWPLLWVLREVMLPAVWVQAWFGNNLSWRGTEMTLDHADPGLDAAESRS